MAGEMSWIKQDGEDDIGNLWPTHAAIAKAVGGVLRPFDQYQGPYIVVGEDLVAGSPPYGAPMHYLGVVRLWVCWDEDGAAYIYREDTDESSPLFLYEDRVTAISYAQSLLAEEKEAS